VPVINTDNSRRERYQGILCIKIYSNIASSEYFDS